VRFGAGRGRDDPVVVVENESDQHVDAVTLDLAFLDVELLRAPTPS